MNPSMNPLFLVYIWRGKGLVLIFVYFLDFDLHLDLDLDLDFDLELERMPLIVQTTCGALFSAAVALHHQRYPS